MVKILGDIYSSFRSGVPTSNMEIFKSQDLAQFKWTAITGQFHLTVQQISAKSIRLEIFRNVLSL